jgi:amino acid adenylation domain-containing protein
MPFATRLRGTLRIDALQAALLALAERHEPLRTTFEQRNGHDMQVVHPFVAKPPNVVDIPGGDWNTLMDALNTEHTTPFNLEIEPGWRTKIFRLDKDDLVLSITMHHIISDGWSVDLLQRELSAFYDAATRGRDPLSGVRPLPIQYRDFSVWQRQEAQTAEHERQLEYWSQQLEGCQAAEFLCDKPRPVMPSGKAQLHEVSIDGALYRNLQEFCKTHQATPFVVLLSAFKATHYRLTGVEDALIGTPIANRNRQELEDLIGFFVNLQCIRTTIGEEDSFQALVRQVQDTTAAASANQDVPFERLVAELRPGARDLSRNPLVQMTFAVHSQRNIGYLRLGNLESQPIGEVATSRFDLEFHFFEQDHSMRGTVMFADELFDYVSIQCMTSVFLEILRRGLRNPTTSIATMPLTENISMLSNMGLIEIQRTDYPCDSSVPDVFRKQVAACGDDVAVKDFSTQLTYAELDRQSDQLASWLVQQGLTTENMVGVLAPRSCQTVVAFLGILKANLAYLPLDINAPLGRLESILSAISGRKLVLLGPDVVAPAVASQDIEFVSIAETQFRQTRKNVATLPTPKATSLAYVTFTSGSTGKPKGVMVEHRGILRLVKQTNVISQAEASVPTAHLTNLAFDAATWEIFTALLNGGTVVCINHMAVFDIPALSRNLEKEMVRVALFTPALLKQCLMNSPETISRMETLFVGGDRLDARDASQAKNLVRGRFINAYGPTENSVMSTIFDIEMGREYVNGVPIGRAISNSGALVMDRQQRLVPLGVMGELVVTGDGLARGYTDPALDRDRFVDVTVNGELLKAYRTGDRVRYRPTDGQIEFFGRMDYQIKLRGHRIELTEVEQALLRDSSVSDAVALVRELEGRDPEIVSFVTTREDKINSNPVNEHTGIETAGDGTVKDWTDFFESDTYVEVDSIDPAKLGRDFMGWTSMYNGEPIDRGELNEWLDETIAAIRRGGHPTNVFEIGTGTGMILFNLAEGTHSYAGVDPSAQAVTFVNKMAKSMPSLADKVDVRIGTAADVGQLGQLNSPDLVVINSVAQYFPTAEYLSTLVEKLLNLDGVERIFFGDIRSYALYRDFGVTKALHLLGASATKEGVKRQLAGMEEAEEELVVDPAYFTNLLTVLPDLVHHVEILPKRMKATNELSCYRFAAVIHAKRPNTEPRMIHEIDDQAWINFEAKKLDRKELLRLLQGASTSTVVPISNVPFGKTIVERHLVDSLDVEERPTDEEPMDWLTSIRQSAHRCSALSPFDMSELAEEAGFRVELSWARQRSLRGGIDAVFHRIEGQRPLFRFLTEHQGQSKDSLTNRPLRRQKTQEVEAHLRTALQATLPAYMIPTRINVLDNMPLTSNGKVDRRALAKVAQGSTGPGPRAIIPPKNDEQRALCDEFAHVLGLEVGITDNFFDLGGHSLMATRLLSRINTRLNWKMSLRDLYQFSTPEALYKEMASRDNNGLAPKDSHSYIELHSRKNSRATLVLLHGFWGTGSIFSDLVPMADVFLDVMIVHDPFFGGLDSPQTIDEWAAFYLPVLKECLPSDHHIFLGGYSFGGLIALKMASRWHEWFAKDLTSLILLDPGTFEAINVNNLPSDAIDKEIEYGLQLFGRDQKDYVLQHWKKVGSLMASLTERPEYHGKGLYFTSNETTKLGVSKWWAANYSHLCMHHVDTTHHTFFKDAIKEVSQAINEHCSQCIKHLEA